jgi:hypothetical protein
VWLIAVLCGAATIANGRVAAQDVVINRGSLDLLDARSIGDDRWGSPDIQAGEWRRADRGTAVSRRFP